MPGTVTRLKKQRYDYVFSIGEACFCASALLRAGLRTASDPFDWCIRATFTERVQMIIDGFPDFINQADLVYLDKRTYPEPCHIYQNTRNGIIFNHDFPLDKTLEESYDAVRAKYDRRIQRLLKTIQDSQRVLLVYMELPSTLDGVGSTDVLSAAAAALNQAFPETQVDILYVRHDAAMKDGQAHYQVIDDHVTVAVTNVAKKRSDDPHAVNKKNIARALSYVRREGQALYLLKRRFVRFPTRGKKTYIRVLGIKIRFKGKKK